MGPSGNGAGTALVTGALGGLGAALVRALAEQGGTVAAVDLGVDDVRLDVAFGALPVPDRQRIRAYAVDVTDPEAVRGLLDDIDAAVGPVDTVYANAGVGGGGGIDAPDEVWESCWQVNVMSHVRLARVVVPRMLARGGGTFVSVASAAGLLSNLGNAPYSVTKHAAVAFAEWLAIAYADAGLDVHLVAPMGIDTPMLRAGRGTLEGESVRALGVIAPDEAARRILDGVAAGRFLVLTHPEVAEFERARAQDRDRWLAGMRRAQRDVLRALGRD